LRFRWETFAERAANPDFRSERQRKLSGIYSRGNWIFFCAAGAPILEGKKRPKWIYVSRRFFGSLFRTDMKAAIAKSDGRKAIIMPVIEEAVGQIWI